MCAIKADGGVSWSVGADLPQAGAFGRSRGDPSVDWTSDGSVWASSLLSVSGGGAFRSTDGGNTWNFDGAWHGPASAEGILSSVDKPLMWSDKSPTSAFQDYIYVAFTADATNRVSGGFPGTIFVNRRNPSTGQWGPTPEQVSKGETWFGLGTDVKTNADGAVWVVWADTGEPSVSYPSAIYGALGGNAPFASPVRIALTYASYEVAIPAQSVRKLLIYPYAAMYTTFVHVVWQDLSGADGCTSNIDSPGTNISSTCKTRVWFKRSVDGGLTWNMTALIINNQPDINDQFNPAIAADPISGIVAITYYDTIGSGARTKANVFYQVSRDHGLTWSGPRKITGLPSDESDASASFIQFGDCKLNVSPLTNLPFF